MHATATPLVSEEEFLQRPVTNQQVELIDGEVYLAPCPSLRHQRLADRLVIRLVNWIEANDQPFIAISSPLDVRLGESRILQPDVVVFGEPFPENEEGPITETPLICVEVISNRKYDRVTKKLVYAAGGVEEYWCLHQSGEFERWTGLGLAAHEVVKGVLTSARLPGFSLDLDRFFNLSHRK